jgi:large subunit ribosomal protein L25
MNNTITIKNRLEIGKTAKNLLKEKSVPAVIYSAKGESTPITLTLGEVEKVLLTATKATIIDLIDGDKVSKVVIKEAQRHPVTESLMHVAFFRIDEDAEMVFDIPFVLEGVSLAVKNNLGAIQMVITTLKVKCKVNDLLPSLTIDISKLDRPGQTVKVSDLNIPASIKLFHAEDKDATIVTITEFEKEEVKEVVADAAATATPAAAAAPAKASAKSSK